MTNQREPGKLELTSEGSMRSEGSREGLSKQMASHFIIECINASSEVNGNSDAQRCCREHGNETMAKRAVEWDMSING